MRALLVVLAFAACDSPHVQVAWTVTNLATGKTKPCPDGATTARLSTSMLEEYVFSNTSGATRWSSEPVPHAYRYSCRDSVGWTDAAVPDDDRDRGELWDLNEGAEIVVEFLDDGERIVATSLPAYVPADDLSPVAVQLIEDGGYFTFVWWQWPASYQPWFWCSDGRRMRINVEGTDTVYTEILECDGFRPVRATHPTSMSTQPLPPGLYNVWIDTLDDTWAVVRNRRWDHCLLGANNDVVGLGSAACVVSSGQ